MSEQAAAIDDIERQLRRDLNRWLNEHGGAVDEFDFESQHEFVAGFLLPRLRPGQQP